MVSEGVVPRRGRRRVCGDAKAPNRALLRLKTTPAARDWLLPSKDSEMRGNRMEMFRSSTLQPRLELGNALQPKLELGSVDSVLQQPTRTCSLPENGVTKSSALKKMASISEFTETLQVGRSDVCERLRTPSKEKGPLNQGQLESRCQKYTASVENRGNPQQPGADKSIILFDWDDTLFPTTWVYDAVKPRMPKDDGDDTGIHYDLGQPEKQCDSGPFAKELAAFAEDLEKTLRAARKVAQVAIVTLSKRPWVEDSAAKYLPSLDLPALLDELDIPVFYTREHVRPNDICYADEEQGVDPFTVAKTFAMKSCIQHLSLGQRKACPNRFNILSVGDSDAERSAAKELRWCLPQLQGQRCYCKTVKLMEGPTLEQLSDQLQVLQNWIDKMMERDDDFDFDLE